MVTVQWWLYLANKMNKAMCVYVFLNINPAWLARRQLISLYNSWPSIRLFNSNEQPQTNPQQSTKDPYFLSVIFGRKKRLEYQIILSASSETCTQVKKQQSEPDMEQQTGSKLGKEYIKAVDCHPVY